MVSADSAARRALCLAALVTRAEFEYRILERSAGGKRREEQENHANDINLWLETEALSPHLSRAEIILLGSPLGEWSPQAIANGQWRGEALAALTWALTLVPAAGFDQPADPRALLAAVKFMQPAVDLVSHAQLRNEAEVRGARNVAELWLWRSRSEQIMREKIAVPVPSGMSIEDIIREAAVAAENDGLFRRIDGDFPAQGRAYRDLSDEDTSLLRSIASERLYALNWLCGQSPDWDSVETPT
jgi:uncharacterized protein DUF4272